MNFYERTITSGKVLEIVRYGSIRKPGIHTLRDAHFQKSTFKQQQRLSD